MDIALEYSTATDLVQIQQVIARYCFAMDRGRLEELLGLFAPNSRFEIYGRSAEGPAAIQALFAETGKASQSLGRRVRPFHVTALPRIDLQAADRATAQTYVQVITNEGADHWARYDDEFHRHDGSWRIASRRITVLASIAGGLGEHLARAMTPA